MTVEQLATPAPVRTRLHDTNGRRLGTARDAEFGFPASVALVSRPAAAADVVATLSVGDLAAAIASSGVELPAKASTRDVAEWVRRGVAAVGLDGVKAFAEAARCLGRQFARGRNTPDLRRAYLALWGGQECCQRAYDFAAQLNSDRRSH
jgi:hypothetical protein